MNRFLTPAVMMTILMLAALIRMATAEDAGITPYGDSCNECAFYGVCKDILPPSMALHALNRYYREKGYRVGAVYFKGRFMEAVIYKNNREVDKVIFDRKTGRLRSVY